MEALGGGLVGPLRRLKPVDLAETDLDAVSLDQAVVFVAVGDVPAERGRVELRRAGRMGAVSVRNRQRRRGWVAPVVVVCVTHAYKLEPCRCRGQAATARS